MNFKEQAKYLPLGKGVKIVACDSNGVIALDKPEGILSHPNKDSEVNKSLLKAPYDSASQAYKVELEEGIQKEIHLLNRLDSATSGLILLTLNELTRGPILKAFENKAVKKTYEALVFGMPRKGNPLWKDRLSVRKAEGGVRASTGGTGNLGAETKLVRCKPIPGMPLLSLLTLMPLTGRTHQLRIQTSKRNIPIVGDRTYGDFQKNKSIARAKGIKRLCLHCVSMELTYSYLGKKVGFKALSPSPFKV
ncbi:pseudouridine synthase [Puniceicoccaceae bacterium K14]|nr:pseudouridine synthase [Puniceicoccaceae bacterium K14]